MFLCIGCSKNPETEKYQYNRSNVINVKDKIQEIEIDSLVFSSASDLYIIDDYLLIADQKSYDHYIQIVDKNTFNYVTSVALRGQGPGEITRLGGIAISSNRRKFEATDYGKQAIYSYDLDSVLADPDYMPILKLKIQGEKLLRSYQYINEKQCIGLIVEPVGNSDFKVSVGTQNRTTGEFRLMPYVHPDIKKKRVAFAASLEHGIYVECYQKQNLMTICSLDGKLKYNIYGGQNWRENERERNQTEYYQHVAFAGDKIIVLYLNDKGYNIDSSGTVTGNTATKFLVFDLNGDYLKTLETDCHIRYFCYDEKNNRIVLSTVDEMQFGYFSLDGLLK